MPEFENFTWVTPRMIDDDSLSYEHLTRHISLTGKKPVSPQKLLELTQRQNDTKVVMMNRATNKEYWQNLFKNELDMIPYNDGLAKSPIVENQGPFTRDQVKSYFTEFKDIGGVLNYIVIDDEFNRFPLGKFRRYDGIYESMDNDSRFDHIREMGDIESFTVFNDISVWTNKGYLISYLLEKERVKSYQKYIVDPIQEVFPECIISSYSDYDMPLDSRPNITPERNGHMIPKTALGSGQSPVIYGKLGQISSINIPDMMGGEFPATPFNALKLCINRIRVSLRHSTKPVLPWTNYRFASDFGSQWYKNPSMFDELNYHIAMHGIKKWPMFNLVSYDNDNIINNQLKELEDIIGDSDCTPLTLREMDYNTDNIISGCRMMKRNKTLWRITHPDGSGLWVESNVEEDDLWYC